jgi:4-amino-4-deoxy-L-arabinose transferase-like glycosyltransferase
MFKGGPGGFPPLFLLGIICLRRQWNALWRFVRSGAPLVILLLSLPWFIYAHASTQSNQIQGEVDELFEAVGHSAHFWNYALDLTKATLPWSLVALAAVGIAAAPMVDAIRRADKAARAPWAQSPQAVLLVWMAAIIVPLCILPQKQFHYLLPMMPPIMILVGWALDLASRDPRHVPKVLAAAIDGTLLGTLLAVPGVLIAAHHVAGTIRLFDWLLALFILLALAAVAAAHRWAGRSGAILAYLAGCTLIFPAAVGIWMPSMEPNDSTAIAEQLDARYGRVSYVFYGSNYSLPLCFNLRRAIPLAKKPEDLVQFVADHPDAVIIAQTKSKAPAPVPPAGFVEEMRLTTPGQLFQIYRRLPESNRPI